MIFPKNKKEEAARKIPENAMQYEPGESIGAVAAQSLAEPATQLTMETYHAAGAAQVSLQQDCQD